MTNDGWIKIHRKLLEWEWADSSREFALFIHLLLHANYKESKWRGLTILPGQLLTGRVQLAQWTGLSERQIRTGLKNLISTGEVTSKTTNRFSIITIVNWQMYQLTDQQNDQQTTNKRPANDQLTTTSKNIKNIKKEKKGKNRDLAPDCIKDIWNEILGKELGECYGIGTGENLKKFLEAKLFLQKQTDWEMLFLKCKESNFLMGKEKNWKVSLTWLVNYDNALKVLNDEYKNTMTTNKFKDVSRELFDAAGAFGNSGASEAKEKLGNRIWEAIQASGGWYSFCTSSNATSQKSFISKVNKNLNKVNN